MQSLQHNAGILEFGEFSLDIAERRLVRRGEAIPLMPKAFDLLAVLVSNEGKLVTKAELMARVWPDVAVEESNLTNNITLLRKTLGKEAIETVPRHGYRFTEPVRQRSLSTTVIPAPPGPVTIERHSVTRIVTEEVEFNDETPVAQPVRDLPALPAGDPPFKKMFFWIGGVVGVLLLLAAGTGLLVRKNAPRQPEFFAGVRQVAFTSEPGQEMRPAFAPDGNRVALIWDGPDGDNFDIYIKDVGGTGMRRLTTDQAFDTSPVWSPDGRWLAFLRRLEVGFTVVLISADGGPERMLGTATDGLAWTPDGRFLTISDRPRPGALPRIHLLAVNTGQKQPIATDFDAPGEDARSAVSPDGKTVAFIRYFGEIGEIFTVPVGGGAPRQVTSDKARCDSLAWWPDGSGIIFASTRGGEYSPWWVAPDGGAPVPIPSLGVPCRDLTIAPTGTRMAYRRVESDLNIFRMEFFSTKPADCILDSTQVDDSPQISSDGGRLVFTSGRSGHLEIWTAGPDGRNLIRITHFDGPQVGSPRWSPDGKTIVFDSRKIGESDIFLVPADGGDPKLLTEGTFRNVLPSWSRDGKWIYFCSNRSGTNQIWKMSPTGGAPTQVTTHGGWEGFESLDGTALFFTRGRDVSGIWKRDLATGAESLVTELSKAGRNRSWYPGRTGLYFIARTSFSPLTWGINRYEFSTGKVVFISPLKSQINANPGNLTVAPDEKKGYFVQETMTGSDLVLVENVPRK
jgi:Tol biopolymer transport system component/DNA-binding winged helix-turn-helix (wHTH) protein